MEDQGLRQAEDSSARVGELELECERAKERWATCAAEHARLQQGGRSPWKRSRRKVERSAAELEDALSEYGQAWRRLEDARREAGLIEPVAPISERPAEVVENKSKVVENKSKVSLSRATLDELRDAGMSATQARRVMRYHETHGDFASIDGLDAVPGFPEAQLAKIKQRLIP